MNRKKPTKFYTPGSPLEGVTIPSGWFDLDLNAKRNALVANGLAHDFAEASSTLSKHGAAVRRARKERDDRNKNRRTW